MSELELGSPTRRLKDLHFTLSRASVRASFHLRPVLSIDDVIQLVLGRPCRRAPFQDAFCNPLVVHSKYMAQPLILPLMHHVEYFANQLDSDDLT